MVHWFVSRQWRLAPIVCLFVFGSVAAGALGFKKTYTVNEIDLLATGDVLLLFTDGFSEHAGDRYFPDSVGRLLASSRDWTAERICAELKSDLLDSGEPHDDISFVVVKKT